MRSPSTATSAVRGRRAGAVDHRRTSDHQVMRHGTSPSPRAGLPPRRFARTRPPRLGRRRSTGPRRRTGRRRARRASRRRRMQCSGGPTMPNRSTNSSVSFVGLGGSAAGVLAHVVGVVHLVQHLLGVRRRSGCGPMPSMAENRAKVVMPPRARARAVDGLRVGDDVDERADLGGARPRGVTPAAHATRSGSAPTASSVRSAPRPGEVQGTFGPVATTSTGTGSRSAGSQCRRLSRGRSARPEHVDRSGVGPARRAGASSNAIASPRR